ncbi:carbohydrate ABC transporter permease [Homoserinibacter sp. YIM 151385]|uniref:carbohydrate ABC transporter permease n=1 Tax=Homoserinibacter sp. YIM 151385 TaxID=2985506 RepID=UPI0022F063E7|nr:carbohydrate ABC transporter permease [Homoserinibacter sp. YIM 151385]WBU37121.1 carbohydrate ABC transporter permease [Homoserinibacter sp. YIM 151385]
MSQVPLAPAPYDASFDARPGRKDGEPVAPRRRGRLRNGQRAGWPAYVFLIAVLIASVFPLYWSFLIGSGDASTVNRRDIPWWPGGNFLANAAAVLNDPAVNFWKAIGNSILVSTVVSVSVVFFSTLAGYAFAKLRFRGSRPLLVFVIATMAVPTQLGVVPLFLVMRDLQLQGTIGAVILPALVTAFGVFWMTQYLSQALPSELIEAARVDGASMIRTFWSVALPAARPAAAMLALFTFIATWTNFFWPFIVLNPQDPTLPVALSLLQSNHFVDYSIVLAGVVLSTIPLLILFVVAGKQLVSGIMQGAIKG